MTGNNVDMAIGDEVTEIENLLSQLESGGHFDIPVKRVPANWEKFGRSAGHRRNAEMAQYADGLVAFWDGLSPGTRSMIDLAKGRGLKVHIEMI